MSYDSWLEPPENFEPEGKYEECADCDGKGKIQNPEYDGQSKGIEQEVECWHCDGQGETKIEPCDDCGHAPCSCDEQYEAWKDSRDE